MVFTVLTKEMKKLNSLIPFVTFSAILVSVWHEWVFYQWLEPDFVDIPQASDYLISAMRWLPFILIYMAFGLILGLLTEDPESIPGQSRLRSIYIHGPYWLILICFVVAFPFYFFLDPSRELGGLVFLGAIAWFPFAEFVSKRPLISRKLTPLIFYAWNYGPPVLLSIAGYAMYNAEEILRFDSGQYNLILEEEDPIYNAVLVRNLSAGMLVALPDDRSIRYIQWTDISSVNVIGKEFHQENRLCRWTEYTCFSEAQNVSNDSE